MIVLECTVHSIDTTYSVKKEIPSSIIIPHVGDLIDDPLFTIKPKIEQISINFDEDCITLSLSNESVNNNYFESKIEDYGWVLVKKAPFSYIN